MTLEELMDQHGGYWGEHPEYPLVDWRLEAAAGDTRLGYWYWVLARLEEL